MFSVEVYAKVRRAVLVDGMTRREAARIFGVHRNTISKMLAYAVSQRIRKRIEEGFGWMKTCGGMRKTRHVGNPRVAWTFTLTAAACYLVRLPKLMAPA